MEHLGFASSGAVLQYLKTAGDYGLDAHDLLAQAGISSDLLNNKLKRISGEAFQDLLAILIERTQDPCFGLKSSRYVQPGSYSVLGYMLMNCRGLQEALEKTPTYERLVGDMGTSQISRLADGNTEMRWICNYPNPKVRPHMIANVLGSWVNFARFLVDKPNGKPKAVYFEFPQPDASSLRQYQSTFNCPLYFNQSSSALIIDDHLLSLPMRQPDQQLLKTLENHADILMADINDKQPLPMQTKNVIRGLLLEGIPRKEMVSKRLGLTERTLQRKLQAFDCSYQQLLDEVREEQAKELLVESELSIQDIAARLGFSEPRSFHRSFKNWTGMTPGEFRQSQ